MSRKYLIEVGGLDIIDVLCFYVSIVATVCTSYGYLPDGMDPVQDFYAVC